MPSAVEECRKPSVNFTSSGEWSPCITAYKVFLMHSAFDGGCLCAGRCSAFCATSGEREGSADVFPIHV